MLDSRVQGEGDRLLLKEEGSKGSIGFPLSYMETLGVGTA